MNSVDDAEAAAVTFPVGSFTTATAALAPAGMRIKVNPDEAARVAADDQVMRHELTHYLTLRAAGRARRRGSRRGWPSATSTAPGHPGRRGRWTGDAYEHVMEVRRRLPTGGRWGLDPQADYLIGRAAVTHLVADAYGARPRCSQLGAAYRRIPGDDPDEKTDAVLRKAFGISEADLGQRRTCRPSSRDAAPGCWSSVPDPEDLAGRVALDRLDVRAGGVGDGDRDVAPGNIEP